MFIFSCNMLPDSIAKLYLKNNDYYSYNTRNKNHLKLPVFLLLLVQESEIVFHLE